jgi:ligand-binding SRPBCC domain-containing protein
LSQVGPVVRPACSTATLQLSQPLLRESAPCPNSGSSPSSGKGTPPDSAYSVVVSEPIECRFSSVLAAPPGVVWERAGAVRGANDELWPFAKMTFPFRLDRRTPPEQVVGHHFRSWTLALGFLPVSRRTMRIEVFEEGRFRECSASWLQGRCCHERTAVAGNDGSTVLTDTLVTESRGRLVDALINAMITVTFRRRHRRLRNHFDKASAEAG